MARRNICGGTCSQPPALPRDLTLNKLLRWTYWHQRGWILSVMLAGTFVQLLGASVPYVAGKAIDKGIQHQSPSHLVQWLSVLAVISVGTTTGWIIRHRLALGIHIRTQAWYERLIAARILDPRGGLDNEVTPGELVNNAAVDARRVAHLLDISGRGSGSIVTFALLLSAMFAVRWQLAIAVIVSVIPTLTLLFWRLRVLERRTHAQQQTLAAASAVAADTISGARVVKGVNGEAEALRRYNSRALEIEQAGVRTAKVRAEAITLELMMPMFVLAVVAWLGGHLALDGNLSTGQLITLFGWTVFMMTPLLTFGEVGRKWAMARGAAARLVDVLTLPVATNATGDVVLAETKGAVQIDGIAFTPHTITAVVADAETSKAMATAIGRLTDLESGRVFIDGIDIRNVQLDSLRQTILVAEHDAALFEGSLRFNLSIADPFAGTDTMLEALHIAAADDIVELLDGGLEGAVFERGRSLSGGQRQRVALARALLAHPPVLVLIDPTSALDSYTEAEIVERLPRARTGSTTIIFTLSPALLSIADEVIAIEDNNVLARGKHIDLLQSSTEYAATFSFDEVAS